MRYKWEQWNTKGEKGLIETNRQSSIGNINGYNNNLTVPEISYSIMGDRLEWYYYPAQNNALVPHIETDGEWVSLQNTDALKTITTQFNGSTGMIPAGNYFACCRTTWNHDNNKFAVMSYAEKDVYIKTAETATRGYYAPYSGPCLQYEIGTKTLKGDTKQKEYFPTMLAGFRRMAIITRVG